MSRWGRGGMVGVGKAIWEHEQTEKIAAAIIRAECGIKHEHGSDAEKDRCECCQSRRDPPMCAT